MKGRYNDVGRQRAESDRHDDHQEEVRSRHLHRSTSFLTEQEIQNREVMAGRHNLSSVQKDRLQLMAESREINEDSRQSLIIKNHKGSSMHLKQHQPTKDANKRAEEHKSKCENSSAKQSRRKQEEPEAS